LIEAFRHRCGISRSRHIAMPERGKRCDHRDRGAPQITAMESTACDLTGKALGQASADVSLLRRYSRSGNAARLSPLEASYGVPESCRSIEPLEGPAAAQFRPTRIDFIPARPTPSAV